MSDAPKRPIARVMKAVTELGLLLSPACEKFVVAGSVRRRVPLIGDIELVAIPRMESRTGVDAGDLFTPQITEKVNRLWEVLDVIAGRSYTKHGPKYRQFIWKDSEGEQVKVDLFTARQETWGLILAIRTGPWEFSRSLMTRLSENGYRSMDGEVIRQSDMKFIATPSEEDVFKLARVQYREPFQRG